MTKESLQEVCLISDKKYSNVINYLNTKLRDCGEKQRVSDLLVSAEIKPIHNNLMTNKRLNVSEFL